MIGSVKGICQLIDTRIGYVEDAYNSDSSKEELKEYYFEMYELLNKSISTLKKNSSNEKLITKYETKIKQLFEIDRIKNIMY